MARELYKRVSPHLQRVLADGGTTPSNMPDLFLLQQSNEKYKDVLKLAFCPELYGNNIRTYNGVNYIQKSYSNESLQIHNDLTQTSSSNQPILDKIAPAEKLSAKNPNNGINYITHPSISFGATEDFCVEIVVKQLSYKLGNTGFFGGGYRTRFSLDYQVNKILFSDDNDHYVVDNYTNNNIGKNAIYHVMIRNKYYYVYENGILKYSYNYTNYTGSVFNKLFSTFDSNNLSNSCISSYHIFSKALSASEVAERSAILRSIFPEIPFTRIGDQIWSVRNFEATVTPQGNLIPEMQAASNVETLTNGSFSDSTGWTANTGWSIDTTAGKAISSNGTTLTRVLLRTLNKYLKITTIISDYISGNVTVNLGWLGQVANYNSAGTFINYVKVSSTGDASITLNGNGTFNGSIDNVSVQEIGWSGSQELYDVIYAQTAEAASSVEKITNGVALVDSNGDNVPDGFSSGDIPNLSIVTGNGFSGRAVRMINNTGIQSITTLNSSRYYKVSFEYRGNGARIAIGGNNDIQLPVNTGDAIKYTVYSKGGLGNGLYLIDSAVNLWAEYGNISVKELGLSDATSISNYTYAAVKAAAMWCHYGNDSAIGAIYGKLYNWFAVKLLQMDIDYYNANNPTTPWGWRVPTQADFITLATNLGGTSVAGGKMKTVGTAYWNSPNTGADNSSGFSAIGCGVKTSISTNLFIKERLFFHCLTEYDINNNFYYYIACDSVVLSNWRDSKIQGMSLRLIKS